MQRESTTWRSPLYLVEWLALLGAAATALLYLWFGLGDRGFLVFYRNMVITAVYLYPLGLLLCYLAVTLELGIQWRKAGSPGPAPNIWNTFRTRYLRLDLVIRDFRYLHAVSLCLIVSIHLKHLIPWINPKIFDPQFLLAEQALLSGEIGFQFLAHFIPLSWTSWLSTGYQMYYPYLSLLVFVMILQRDSSLTRQFCIAFTLTWYLGMLTVYSMPTLGPCFYAPELFLELPESRMSLMQQDLWSMKLTLEQDPRHPTALFAISGFPSLHFAVALLGTWYLFRVNILLGTTSLLFALITLVTTVYFGWHYLVDDIGSVALVAMCIYLTKKLEARCYS